MVAWSSLIQGELEVPQSHRLINFFPRQRLMTNTQVPGNPNNGASSGGSPAGNGKTHIDPNDFAEIGSLNEFGNKPNENLDDPLYTSEEIVESQTPQQQPQKKEEPATEPTGDDGKKHLSKDERHASTKITELSEQRLKFARIAIERDKEAIYDIASTDRKVAEKLFEEYEYEADSLDELIAKHENPGADAKTVQEKIQNDERYSKLEEDLMSEKLNRLRQKHEDLDTDLEQEFRKINSNPLFESKTEEEKLNIARASLGKTTPSSESNQVALDILKTQEGMTTTPKGGAEAKKKQRITPGSERHYESAGVTEKDLEKYLPDNIDDLMK